MKLTTGFAGVLRAPQPQTYTAHMLKIAATHRFIINLCVIIPQTSVIRFLAAFLAFFSREERFIAKGMR
jgi:hypothetical protein